MDLLRRAIAVLRQSDKWCPACRSRPAEAGGPWRGFCSAACWDEWRDATAW